MGSQPLLCLVLSSHVFIGVYLGPSVQPTPPVFGIGVCGNACQKLQSVRGNALASSWKLRNMVLVWRITRRKLSGLCQGSKW